MYFLLEYLKNPRKIGAIAPSGNGLSRKMVKPIDFRAAKVIVEYGSGTGAFTRELVIRRKIDTTLILIEQNEDFCRVLNEIFQNQPNLHIIHGSAEYVNCYLSAYGFQEADYIVSGLPFTSLPQNISSSILAETRKAIGHNGTFITFQYSLVKQKFFEKYFQITERLKEMKNLPPAFVLVMKVRG